MYRTVLTGAPEDVYRLCRQLGVNYFYIEKDNLQFWGPGVTETFNAVNLGRYFDVAYESQGFYIFTWRGQGIRAVSDVDVAVIRDLQAKSQAQQDALYISAGWLGLQRYEQWLAASKS